MSFVVLHKENAFFEHERSVINTREIVSITPITMENGWHDQKTSLGRLALTNGEIVDVKEGVDQIIALLSEVMNSALMPQAAH